MTQSALEKRIKERATERFEKEYKELFDYLWSHPIAKYLTIKIGERNIPLANFGRNYALFNEEGVKNKYSEFTNLDAVKSELIKQYEKEETDALLDKLETISYLFRDDE